MDLGSFEWIEEELYGFGWNLYGFGWVYMQLGGVTWIYRDLRVFGKYLNDLWASGAASCGALWWEKIQGCGPYTIPCSVLGWMAGWVAGWGLAGWLDGWMSGMLDVGNGWMVGCMDGLM